MGVALGNSPDEVVAAIGWRRPERPTISQPPRAARTEILAGAAATVLAALGPLVIVGVSRSLGAALIIVATALAGISSTRPLGSPRSVVMVVSSVASVNAGVMAFEQIALGVRIGSAVLGLMLAGGILAVQTEPAVRRSSPPPR